MRKERDELRKKFLSAVLALTVIVFSTISVSAYEYKDRDWPTDEVRYIFASSMESSDSYQYQIAWDNAIYDWNNGQDSIQLVEGNTGAGNYDMIFGIVSMTVSNVWGICSITTTSTTNANICESGTAYININAEDIEMLPVKRSAAAHEIGHVFSLADINAETPVAIMNTTRVRRLIYTPQEDDIEGVVNRYS